MTILRFIRDLAQALLTQRAQEIQFEQQHRRGGAM